MLRRAPLLLVLISVLVVSACATAQPTAPQLTDPRDILAKAARATATARSFHFTVVGSGALAGALPPLPPGAEVRLDGATVEGDVDLDGRRLRASFALPALLNLSGDIVQVGDDAWVRTSLTGPGFQGQAAGALPFDALSDASAVEAAIQGLLDLPGVAPSKVEDTRCGDNRDCYQVRIELTGRQLAALAPGVPLTGVSDPGDAGLSVTFGIEKESLRMSRLVGSVTSGDGAEADLTVDLSRWGEPVTIEPPVADQAPG